MCESSPTCQELTLSSSSRSYWWTGKTKTDEQVPISSTPKKGNGVSACNVGELSHLDVALCPRRVDWNPLPRKLQDWYSRKYIKLIINLYCTGCNIHFLFPIPVVLIGHNCLTCYLFIASSQLPHHPSEFVTLKREAATSFNPVRCNNPGDYHLSNKFCEILQKQTQGAWQPPDENSK
jgi:hypothetical protein